MQRRIQRVNLFDKSRSFVYKLGLSNRSVFWTKISNFKKIYRIKEKFITLIFSQRDWISSESHHFKEHKVVEFLESIRCNSFNFRIKDLTIWNFIVNLKENKAWGFVNNARVTAFLFILIFQYLDFYFKKASWEVLKAIDLFQFQLSWLDIWNISCWKIF